MYITFKLYPYCHVAVMVVCVLSGCCFLYYYGKVGFSLPGIASSGIEPDEESRKNIRYCKPCKIIKQPGTKHCYYCDVCILKIDHHCPWVGKCIGRDNICLFYVFLMSVGVAMLMYTLATITADFKWYMIEINLGLFYHWVSFWGSLLGYCSLFGCCSLDFFAAINFSIFYSFVKHYWISIIMEFLSSSYCLNSSSSFWY